MEVIKKMIDVYYAYNENILLGLSLLFFLTAIVLFVFFEENKRYTINAYINKVFISLAIICIGELFKLFDLVPQVEDEYFNILIFILISSVIVSYELLQAGLYKKIILPIMQICKYVPCIVFFELFLLIITEHLERIEWVTAITAILLCNILTRFLKKITYKEERREDEYDYPNADLYYSRERQLEKFIEVLEQQKYEPYAIMVSGEWGTGKSSFILALEKRLTKDVFIRINTGSEKSVSEIMLEISEQLIEVLKENNILVEKGGVIEKYFLAFSGLLDETKLKFFNTMTNIFGKNESNNSKEYLNGKLKELNKTVYLVIDDLDRCDEEYQLKMFKVIRESTELANCKTLFLVDKLKFLNNKYDENYIEKYVSYTLELCAVEYQEIVSRFFDVVFKEDFISNMNPVLLKGRDRESIKRMIYGFPYRILNICKDELAKVEGSIKSSEDKEIQIKQAKIEDITKTVSKIENNIANSRKIKNFLKGISRTISKLNVGIEECSQEFQQEDWLKAIVEVQFIKYVLPELFSEIKLSTDIAEFEKMYDGYSIEILLGLKYGLLFPEQNKITILNHIIYNLDTIDFLEIKSTREKYMSELYSDKIKIESVNEYVTYARTYEDMDNILDLIRNQEFRSQSDREDFVKAIFHVMSNQMCWIRSDKQKFFDFSKKLVTYLKQMHLSERERDICRYDGHLIIRRIIAENSNLLRNILLVLFEMTEVCHNWQVLEVTTVDEFYAMLKRVDNDGIYKGLEDDTDKLLSIRTYYINLMAELKKEQYSDIGLNFEKISEDIDIIFECCLFWNNIESELKDKREDEQLLFGKYFELENNSIRSAVFFSVLDLKMALETLNKFYDSKRESYESSFLLLLLRLSYKMVLTYEADSSWFAGKEMEVSELLSKMAQKCYELDKIEDSEAREAIDKIKIYVYKFKSYCEDNTKNEGIEEEK